MVNLQASPQRASFDKADFSFLIARGEDEIMPGVRGVVGIAGVTTVLKHQQVGIADPVHFVSQLQRAICINHKPDEVVFNCILSQVHLQGGAIRLNQLTLLNGIRNSEQRLVAQRRHLREQENHPCNCFLRRQSHAKAIHKARAFRHA